jgi:hypothetical protein
MLTPRYPEALLVQPGEFLHSGNERRIIDETWSEYVDNLRSEIGAYAERVLRQAGGAAVHSWEVAGLDSRAFLYAQLVTEKRRFPVYRFVINYPTENNVATTIADFVITSSHRGIGAQHTARGYDALDGCWVDDDRAGPLIVQEGAHCFVGQGDNYDIRESYPPPFEAFPEGFASEMQQDQINQIRELLPWIQAAGRDNLSSGGVITSL